MPDGRMYTLLICIALALFAALLATSQGGEALTDHAPIHIVGDSNFTAANGVVSGAGTPSDPYVISGWRIDCTDSVGLWVEATTIHFLIRDVRMTAQMRAAVNVRIEGVAGGVEVRDVYLEYCSVYTSFYVEDAENVRVVNVSCPSGRERYMSISGCNDVLLEDVHSGLHLSGSTNVTVRDCSLLQTTAITVNGLRDGRIVGCNITGLQEGVRMQGTWTTNVTVADCRIEGMAGADVRLTDTIGEGVRFLNNTFVRGGILSDGGLNFEVDANNTVGGEPLLVMVDPTGTLKDRVLGQLFVENAIDLLVSNVTVVAGYTSVTIDEGRNVRLVGLVATGVSIGLSVDSVLGLVIEGCTFNGTSRAVTLRDAVDLVFANSTANGGGSYGVSISRNLFTEDSAHLFNVKVSDVEGVGILFSSDRTDVVIEGCSVDNTSSEGIWVYNCLSAVVKGNTLADVGKDEWTYAIKVASIGTVEVVGNTVIHCSAGGVYSDKYSSIAVTDNHFNRAGSVGIDLDAPGGLLSNNTIADSHTAIHLRRSIPSVRQDCYDNTVTGFTYGIWVDSDRTRIEGCVLRTGSGMFNAAIWVDVYSSSSSNTADVTVSDCTIEGAETGIRVTGSRGTVVEKCRISDCFNGLLFEGARLCTVSWCTFIDCEDHAIDYRGGGGNTLHHNNFVRCNYDPSTGKYKGPQAYDSSSSAYDDGDTGNYWSDYTLRYPDATASGRVWDTPYVVDGNDPAQDRYPSTIMFDFRPPVARAGPDRSVPQNTTVTLDGSGSEDDVGIVSWAWDLVYDGEPRHLVGMTASFRFDTPGSYTVTLTVSDAWGLRSEDGMVLTVLDTQAPFAEAGAEVRVAMGETFTLSSEGSWDNVGIVSYVWNVTGEGFSRELEGATVSLSIERPGTYIARLVLLDAAGNRGTDATSVTVVDTVPPVANAGPDVMAEAGEEVALDGTLSRDNVGIITWMWTYEHDGTNITLVGPRVNCTFDVLGQYLVTLTVVDGHGLSGSDTLYVVVSDSTPPTVEAGKDRTVDMGEEVTFDGSWSHDNVAIESFTWTFEHGGETWELPGTSVRFTFERVGEFLVTLVAVDTSGNRAQASLVVTVVDATPPVARAGEDVTVEAGTALALDGAGSSDNVGIARYSWTVHEDGGPVSLEGERVTRTFDEPGTYRVQLEVADAAGLSSADELVVTVVEAEAPSADAGEDRRVVAGTTVTFDGSGSTDNLGIEVYAWTFVYRGTERRLPGMTASFAFVVPGTYEVTLTVKDGGGLIDRDTVNVTVLPAMVDWRLGPFLDGKGRPVVGAHVQVTLNGTLFEGDTDENGWLALTVPWYHLVSPAHVMVEKGGFEPLELDVELGADGSRAGELPAMEKKPKEDNTDWPGAVMGLAALALAAIVGASLRRT